MYLLVGLGNYGREYENTRHNIGFDSIDYLIEKLNLDIHKENKNGILYKYKSFFFLKPKTFMNNSGIAVREFSDYFKINKKDILIIFDDINLEFSKLRLREKGSAGGQNGMKSVINCLNTQEIKRIRIGIGNNPKYDLSDWVLSKFSKQEKEDKKKVLDKIWEIFNFYFLENNTFSKTMSLFNQ